MIGRPARRARFAAWGAALALAACALLAIAQESPTTTPATGPAPLTTNTASELPPPVVAALSTIKDGGYSFDHMGFYDTVNFLKHSPRAPGFADTPMRIKDWRAMLERPSDYRGRVVTIEGLIRRNRDPYATKFEQLGQLWQLDLQGVDQPFFAKVILTENVSDLPLGATVEITGYFILAHQYLGPTGQSWPSIVLVARGPTLVSKPVAAKAGFDWTLIVIAIIVGVAITMYLLRSRSGGRTDIHSLRARSQPTTNLAADLDAWVSNNPPPNDDRPA